MGIEDRKSFELVPPQPIRPDEGLRVTREDIGGTLQVFFRHGYGTSTYTLDELRRIGEGDIEAGMAAVSDEITSGRNVRAAGLFKPFADLLAGE